MLSVGDIDKQLQEKYAENNDNLRKESSKIKDDKNFQDELVTDILEDSTNFLQRSLQEKDEFLENALREKEAYVQNAIKEERGYIENALKEKDEFLENALKEKDEYLENALKDKDEVIQAMQNSFAFRTLSKLDKLLGRKYKK